MITKSPVQRLALKALWNYPITLFIGPAGSGKSLLCLAGALDLLKSPTSPIERIAVVRLAAENPEEGIGALPGDVSEKLDFFLAPLKDNAVALGAESQLKYLKSQGKVEVIPLSHLRGRSFINTFVLVEEAQNMTPAMIRTIVTRLGPGSRLAINGDPNQSDFLRAENGINYCRNLLQGLEEVAIVELGLDEVRRHPVIPKVIARLYNDLPYAYPAKSYVHFGGDNDEGPGEYRLENVEKGKEVPFLATPAMPGNYTKNDWQMEYESDWHSVEDY